MSQDKQKDFGPRFLYAEDLLAEREFKTVSVTIEALHPAGTIRRADKKMIDKPTISFVGKDKMLVLCNVNQVLLKYATGENMGPGWIGKTITLQARIVDAPGGKSTALRVIPPKGTVLRRRIVDLMGTKAVWETATTYDESPPPEANAT